MGFHTHAKYTDSEAIAAAIAGGLSKVIWKDASERALYDLNRTVTLGWTPLDLTAHTSANAKFALLLLILRADTIGTGSFSRMRIRKNGTAPSWAPTHTVDKAGVTAVVFHWTSIIIGLDSGQVIEYTIEIGANWQIDSQIIVVGYIE